MTEDESDSGSLDIESERSSSILDPIDEDFDIDVFSFDKTNEFRFDENLQKLICIGTNFETIPPAIIDQYAHRTKILDLSGNLFRSLASIRHFTNLEELILDDNQLTDANLSFPPLPKLHSLMINKNDLKNLFFLVEHLRYSFPQLTHLSLLGNDACPYGFVSNDQDDQYRRYRHLLIFRLPTLKFLDSRQIDSNERRMAMQLGDILYAIAETKKGFR